MTGGMVWRGWSGGRGKLVKGGMERGPRRGWIYTARPGAQAGPALREQAGPTRATPRADHRFQDVRRAAVRRCVDRAVVTLLAFFSVGPELFWQQPIESKHAQGALLPCALRHIATKPAQDTST